MKNIVRFIIILILILIMGVVGYFVWSYLLSKNDIQLGPSVVWIADDGIKSYPVSDENLLQNSYFPVFALSDLQLFVDYDIEEDVLIITDGYRMQKIQVSTSDESIKKDENGRIFMSTADLNSEFGIKTDYNKITRNLLVKRHGQDFFVEPLKNKATLMLASDMDYHIVSKNNSDDLQTDGATIDSLSGFASVVIVSLDEYYAYVLTSDYQYGVINKMAFKKDLSTRFNDFLENHRHGFFNTDNAQPKRVADQINGKIFLIWDVPRKNEDFNENHADNVNVVVSKTAYKLADTSGKLAGGLHERHLKHVHDRGYLSWPLISNDFKPKRTHVFLNSASARQQFVENIRDEWRKFGYDGINIDFENIYKKDRDKFSQFIAELGVMCAEENIMLSVDVTVMGGSDNWSKCYDRKALGRVVDYMAVMTYDEHWATSPISGSVASYGWVKRGINRIKQDVPSNKILLGIPYYMRVWTEVPSKSKPKMDTSSAVLSIKHLKSYIQKNELNLIWDKNLRQYYSAIIKDNELKKIWFEDARSIGEKVALVEEMNLAGVGIWRHGFENATINSVVLNALAKMVER